MSGFDGIYDILTRKSGFSGGVKALEMRGWKEKED